MLTYPLLSLQILGGSLKVNKQNGRTYLESNTTALVILFFLTRNGILGSFFNENIIGASTQDFGTYCICTKASFKLLTYPALVEA